MNNVKRSWRAAPKKVRQILVGIVGVLVIIAGCFMLVLPGPGWVTIFLGLAILASEFEWADRVKIRLTTRFKSALAAMRAKK
jgi:uncharacterized protein (TIGR02611 family)